ncbi:hypothetical protein ACIHFD_53645 [Nonomuraea sp. NPDC051941]
MRPSRSEAIIRWATTAGLARRLTRGNSTTHQQRYVLDRPTYQPS